ncbi:MAG TPA: TIGR01777 family oxidoreductase [Pseudobdellovibrionaceae bacterium]|nr:TIGR01777 family oxidoreductase [Pseudobdellovibrionaceae bacterium]
MKILVTGATGMVGRELGKALVAAGHRVVIVSRDRESAEKKSSFPCEVVEGDLTAAPVSSHFLDDVEGVIHLMGEPIAKGRWTDSKKKKLVQTRVRATRHLRQSLGGRVKVVVSTSAVGFYGDRGEELLTEESAPGSDFLARLCVDWEREAKEFEKEGARVVCLRLGMVLSKTGGALAEMRPPAKAGVAGPLGDGRQWMGWIHIDDLVGLYVQALGLPEMTGIYNAVAPDPVRNEDFMKCLTRLLHRPGFMRTPAFLLKLLFGEKSTVLLASQKASGQKALATGFRFRFPSLEQALKNLI